MKWKQIQKVKKNNYVVMWLQAGREAREVPNKRQWRHIWPINKPPCRVATAI